MPGTHRPPSHTALAALPAIALDLETTGLDVANDRIVQIGAVSMRGPVIAVGEGARFPIELESGAEERT